MVGSTKYYSVNWPVGTNKKSNMKIDKLNHISHVINQTEDVKFIRISHEASRTDIINSG